LAFEILVIARFEILVESLVKLASHLLQSSKGAFAGHARGKKADPQICSSVIACDKIKKKKGKTLEFEREGLQTTEK